MKNVFFLFIYSILSIGTASCQDSESENKQFKFHLGVQARSVPIYLKRLPNSFLVTDRNIWEQPDLHLSGWPSLVYKIEGKIDNYWSVSFSQAIRYDFLYRTLFFNTQIGQPFQLEDKKAAIADFYLDGEKAIPLRASNVKAGIGLALCGIGSGYLLTQRFGDNADEDFYVTSKENFVFPAITASVGWQKKGSRLL